MGTHLKFTPTCHPQTNGQTEVTNWTLDALHWVLVKKNIKGWDELLPHAKFAFNRGPSNATNLSPFLVVYSHNSRTPLDLNTIPTLTRFSWEAVVLVRNVLRHRIELWPSSPEIGRSWIFTIKSGQGCSNSTITHSSTHPSILLFSLSFFFLANFCKTRSIRLRSLKISLLAIFLLSSHLTCESNLERLYLIL